MDEAFKPASPVRNPETAPYWDAVREGKLLLKKCNACEEVFFYPRSLCPYCLSESSWVESAGKGKIYSHTAVGMRGQSYVLAIVTLAEGPSMMTNILTDDPSSLRVDQPVHVEFVETTGEERLPMFVPSGT